MSDLFAAFGLVLVIEGLVYGGFPGAAKRLAQDVQNVPENTLRTLGLIAMAAGLVIVWMVRRGG